MHKQQTDAAHPPAYPRLFTLDDAICRRLSAFGFSKTALRVVKQFIPTICEERLSCIEVLTIVTDCF
ncbi:uncharacterized protein PHALS_11788 [Plasmopara halstedii]|uniref:Uncharacterized protein n=1 Tax=Plasmopara halstedii TaxID=4781 RepID=A0A0P1AJP1_PLAHL|nr:uncharacterized protein PHALS_11788 [Plasmopara halstedii]CEG41441.1 hypothetical protein PHALS_11788 [Plasmopara halstedii]|eukprot:XP_024577810.1 hypothetical protein PHALS_11788 [Plasmopara halstedii]